MKRTFSIMLLAALIMGVLAGSVFANTITAYIYPTDVSNGTKLLDTSSNKLNSANGDWSFLSLDVNVDITVQAKYGNNTYNIASLDCSATSAVPGVSWNATTGKFTGKPEKAGQFNFKVSVISKDGKGSKSTVTVPIQVDGTAPTLAVSADATQLGGEDALTKAKSRAIYLSATDKTNKNAIIGGTVISDSVSGNPFKFVVSGSVRDMTLNAKITPSGSGLTFKKTTTTPHTFTGDAASGDLIGYFYGTIPNPGKDAHYFIEVTAGNNVTKKVTRYYSFDVIARPKIKSAPAKDVKYNSAFSVKVTPTLAITETPLSEWTISDETKPGYLTSEDLLDYGLRFNKTTGEIKGTWVSADKPKVSFDKNNKVTKYVKVVLSRDRNRVADSADLKLTFVAEKPSILSVPTERFTNIYIGEEVSNDKEKKYYIEATGPGKITWTVASNLPAGLSWDYTSSTDYFQDGVGSLTKPTGNKSYLVFSGIPTEAVKATAVKITAKNAAGEASVSPKFAVLVGTGNFKFDDDTSGDHTMGAWAVGANVDEAALEDVKSPDKYDNADVAGKKVFTVTAGPVKWKADNLPKGIKLVESGDTQAYLSGKFTKATGKWEVMTIGATLKSTGAEIAKPIYYHYRVFDKPVISTKKLGENYSGTMKVKTAYDWDLELKNSGTEKDVTSWDIIIGDSDSNDVYQNSDDGKYYIRGDEDGNGNIVGSIDRVPDGNVLTVKATATNPAGSATATYTIKVEGKEPEFTSKDVTTTRTFSPSEERVETITLEEGTLPIQLSAYISAKQAKKLFGINKDIYLSQDYGDDNPTGFVFEPNDGDEDELASVVGTLTYIGEEANKQYDKLEITIAATNAMTKKPVTYPITMTINGTNLGLAVLSRDDSMASFDNNAEKTIYAIAGSVAGYRDEDFEIEENEGYAIGVQGTAPLEITYPTAVTNGLTMTLRDPTIVDSDRYYKELYISGTPTAGKTTKSKFKITLKNPSTGATFKGTVIVEALMPPEMSSTAKELKKEISMGDALSIKPKAKGYGTITWRLDETSTGDFDDTLSISQDIWDNYGVRFASKDGSFTASKTESTKGATLNDAETAYATKTYYVRAQNIAGYSDPVAVEFGIKGLKPTFKTTKLTYNRGGNTTIEDNDAFALSTDISKYTSTDVIYSTSTTKDTTALNKLGLDLADEGGLDNNNIAHFTGDNDSVVATKAKGTSITFKASNYETTNTGKVTFVINDPTPALEADETTLGIDGDAKKVTATDTISLTEATQGTTKLKWEITKDGKPTTKGITAAIKAAKDAQSATLTITVAAKFNPNSNSTTVTDNVKIRVTNPETKTSGDITIALSVNPYVADDSASEDGEETEAEEAAEGEDEADVETEDELVRGEGDVILGEARSEAALTAGERSAIEAAGYVIAAVLPEVTVTEDGFYDLDVVELVEAAPEGAELVWFAFPRDAAASEDDEIAEFYDEAGAETQVVPEGRKVIPGAWFNADVTYAPVIAVKVENAVDPEDSAEDLEAGDVVTVEALEAAE